MSLNRQTYKLPGSLSGPFAAARDDWKRNEKVRRLWQCDASLWTGTDEGKWLAWLGITAEQLAHLSTFQEIAADVKQAGFKHALLLGMGGSSLCPEVLRMTFGKIDGYPELQVLDSTDPEQIKAIADLPSREILLATFLGVLNAPATKLVRVLNEYIDGPGLTVVIGAEHLNPNLRPFSLVLSTYDDGSGIGTVGVIGPTRMHYSRAIAAVDGAAQAVSRLLRDPN